MISFQIGVLDSLAPPLYSKESLFRLIEAKKAKKIS